MSAVHTAHTRDYRLHNKLHTDQSLWTERECEPHTFSITWCNRMNKGAVMSFWLSVSAVSFWFLSLSSHFSVSLTVFTVLPLAFVLVSINTPSLSLPSHSFSWPLLPFLSVSVALSLLLPFFLLPSVSEICAVLCHVFFCLSYVFRKIKNYGWKKTEIFYIRNIRTKLSPECICEGMMNVLWSTVSFGDYL